MTKNIDFYFDFVSPYSYLAHKQIRKIEEEESINMGDYFSDEENTEVYVPSTRRKKGWNSRGPISPKTSPNISLKDPLEYE